MVAAGELAQFFLRDLKGYPSQTRYVIPPLCFRSVAGSPFNWTCLTIFLQEFCSLQQLYSGTHVIPDTLRRKLMHTGKACQPRKPNNDLIHCFLLFTAEILTTSMTSAREMGKVSTEASCSASSTENMCQSSNCSFHRLPTSPVEVSSCLHFLSCLTICQSVSKAKKMSFSMAPPKPFHKPRFFLYNHRRCLIFLASLYLGGKATCFIINYCVYVLVICILMYLAATRLNM